MRWVLQKILHRCVMASVASLAANAVAQFAPNPPKAPKSLRPPKGQILLFHLKGKGNQIYACQKTGVGYEWNLKGPEAKLFGESGELAGRHFGSTWVANDGSRVSAMLVASLPSPDPGSTAWLLLMMTSRDSAGLMSRVESLQRLDTEGGLLPSRGCSATNVNDETAVPYEAQYYFYGLPRPGVLQQTSCCRVW
jgi:Protein of unknown function (DUF3455)